MSSYIKFLFRYLLEPGESLRAEEEAARHAADDDHLAAVSSHSAAVAAAASASASAPAPAGGLAHLASADSTYPNFSPAARQQAPSSHNNNNNNNSSSRNYNYSNNNPELKLWPSKCLEFARMFAGEVGREQQRRRLRRHNEEEREIAHAERPSGVADGEGAARGGQVEGPAQSSFALSLPFARPPNTWPTATTMTGGRHDADGPSATHQQQQQQQQWRRRQQRQRRQHLTSHNQMAGSAPASVGPSASALAATPPPLTNNNSAWPSATSADSSSDAAPAAQPNELADLIRSALEEAAATTSTQLAGQSARDQTHANAAALPHSSPPTPPNPSPLSELRVQCRQQLQARDYYANYDIFIGLRIATSLSILFVVFILFVIYKTGCGSSGGKRASRSQLRLTSAATTTTSGPSARRKANSSKSSTRKSQAEREPLAEVSRCSLGAHSASVASFWGSRSAPTNAPTKLTERRHQLQPQHQSQSVSMVFSGPLGPDEAAAPPPTPTPETRETTQTQTTTTTSTSTATKTGHRKHSTESSALASASASAAAASTTRTTAEPKGEEPEAAASKGQTGANDAQAAAGSASGPAPHRPNWCAIELAAEL